MSNRTIIELNHDYCPREEDAAELGRALMEYMRSGDPKFLPYGVRYFGMRHHSDPLPNLTEFAWNRKLSLVTRMCESCTAKIGGA